MDSDSSAVECRLHLPRKPTETSFNFQMACDSEDGPAFGQRLLLKRPIGSNDDLGASPKKPRISLDVPGNDDSPTWSLSIIPAGLSIEGSVEQEAVDPLTNDNVLPMSIDVPPSSRGSTQELLEETLGLSESIESSNQVNSQELSSGDQNDILSTTDDDDAVEIVSLEEERRLLASPSIRVIDQAASDGLEPSADDACVPIVLNVENVQVHVEDMTEDYGQNQCYEGCPGVSGTDGDLTKQCDDRTECDSTHECSDKNYKVGGNDPEASECLLSAPVSSPEQMVRKDTVSAKDEIVIDLCDSVDVEPIDKSCETASVKLGHVDSAVPLMSSPTEVDEKSSIPIFVVEADVEVVHNLHFAPVQSQLAEKSAILNAPTNSCEDTVKLEDVECANGEVEIANDNSSVKEESDDLKLECDLDVKGDSNLLKLDYYSDIKHKLDFDLPVQDQSEAPMLEGVKLVNGKSPMREDNVNEVDDSVVKNKEDNEFPVSDNTVAEGDNGMFSSEIVVPVESIVANDQTSVIIDDSPLLVTKDVPDKNECDDGLDGTATPDDSMDEEGSASSEEIPESSSPELRQDLAAEIVDIPHEVVVGESHSLKENKADLTIDETSLDGTSMQLLDEITGSADALRVPSPDMGMDLDQDVESENTVCQLVQKTNGAISKRKELQEVSKLEGPVAVNGGNKEFQTQGKRGYSAVVNGRGESADFRQVEESETVVPASISKLSRKELEVMVLRKISQSIADKSEVKSLLEVVKKKTIELTNYERKYQSMYKQMSDLAVVFKRYVNERKSNPNPSPPSKVTRGVGVQVCMKVNAPPPNKPPPGTSAQRRKPGRPPLRKTQDPAVPSAVTPIKNWGMRPMSNSPRSAAGRQAPSPAKSPVRPPVSPARQPARQPVVPIALHHQQSPVRPAPQQQTKAIRVQTLGAKVGVSNGPGPQQTEESRPAQRAAPMVSAPMVTIPSEFMERSSHESDQRSRMEPEKPPQQIIPTRRPAVSHQSYTDRPMMQTPVVAKVTLPSSVTQMMAAQKAAAQRAASAQQHAAQLSASSNDVIDLTDEDESTNSSMSVVQRSTSFSKSARTVSSPNITVRKNIATSISTAPTSSVRTNISQRNPAITHPAPLPPSAPNPRVALHLATPPKPKVTLVRKGNGISITWNMDLLAQHASIKLYHIYVYQETNAPPSSALWKYIGEINALPLPMACTLKQFTSGHRYHFAVKAKDKFERFGLFSDIVSIVLSV